MKTSSLGLCCAASFSLILTACGYNPPRAWERGHLAKPAMQILADPLETSLLDQMHASKEGASGGASVGGGGCGCN